MPRPLHDTIRNVHGVRREGDVTRALDAAGSPPLRNAIEGVVGLTLHRTTIATLLGCLINGCASGAGAPVATDPDRPLEGRQSRAQAPVGAASTSNPPYSAPMANDLNSMIQAALSDAARRARLDVSALRIVSAENVTWSDGSLGCPAPGRMYTMALVSGYRIRIQAGSEVLDYHAGARGQPVPCPPGRSTEPVADPRI